MYLQLFCFSTGAYILILQTQVRFSVKVYTLSIMIKPRQQYFITYDLVDLVLCVCNKLVDLLKLTNKNYNYINYE